MNIRSMIEDLEEQLHLVCAVEMIAAQVQDDLRLIAMAHHRADVARVHPAYGAIAISPDFHIREIAIDPYRYV